MLTLMKQEYYKVFKQNRLAIWLVISFLFPLIIMGVFKSQRNGDTILAFGQGAIYIYMAGIIITALTVSQEFAFGTIRPLLSRRFSRGMVFASKLVLNLSIYIMLIVAAFIGTMISKIIFVPKFNFADKAGYAGNGWQMMGMQVFHILAGMIFVAGLVLLVTNLVKSSGAAIGMGVVMTIGTPIISSISAVLIQSAPILKWNPFNVYLGMNMYGSISSSAIKEMIKLSSNEVIIAYLVYIVLLYGIAYLIFKKRSV